MIESLPVAAEAQGLPKTALFETMSAIRNLLASS